MLGVMLLGLAALAVRFHIEPRTGQTLLSLISAAALGRNVAYYAVSVVTVIALTLAANTSFGGLPVLMSLLARDNYVPHFLGIRGDRLVYANGIWTLAGLSGALLIAVRGNTNTLIPLFAIGVFTGFTLSQTGLVVHWRRHRPPGWARRAAINATGAVVTAAATVIFLFTKFTAGGWVVVVAVPLLIVFFHHVRAYYDEVRRETALRPGETGKGPPEQTLVVVPVSGISHVVAETLRHARSLSDDVVAVTVRFEDDDRPPLEDAWREWGPGVELVTLVSRYHSVVRPLTRYVDGACATGHTLVVVLIPVMAPRRLLHRLLHNQFDLVLTITLRRRRNVIVARVPYQLAD
jgi:hypothetical protein